MDFVSGVIAESGANVHRAEPLDVQMRPDRVQRPRKRLRSHSSFAPTPARRRNGAGHARQQAFDLPGSRYRHRLGAAEKFGTPSGNFAHCPCWREPGREDRPENRQRRPSMRQVGPRHGGPVHWYRPYEIVRVLHLDPLAPRTPRLPHRRLGGLQLAAAIALHVSAVLVAALIETTPPSGIDSRRVNPTADQPVQHLVFLAPALPSRGSGGGGGGNQQPGPIQRAQAVGSDTITLRVRKRPAADGPRRDSFRTCRRRHSAGAIDCARCDPDGLRPVQSDWPADRRGDVRRLDRSRGQWRRRRHRNRDRYRVGSWARTRPRVRRRNRGRRVPPWRRGIRAAAGQGSQAEVHGEAIQNEFKAPWCWKSSSPPTDARRTSASSARWTAAASMRKPWRPWPNGGSSLDVLPALQSMCSSQSWSTSRFAEMSGRALLALIADWSMPGQRMATLAAAIVAVIAINGAFSFWQEYTRRSDDGRTAASASHQVRTLRGQKCRRPCADAARPASRS